MTLRVITALTLFSVLVSGKEALAQAPTNKPKTDAPAGPGKGPTVHMDVRAQGDSAEVCVTAEDREGGVKNVTLTVDGVDVPRSDAPAARAQTGEECASNAFDVPLLPGTNRLEAVAYSANGTRSQPARDTVWRPSPVGDSATLHILTVGIDTFRGDVRQLSFARKDAQAFADSLRAQAHRLFGTRVRVVSLYDAAATKAAIENAFVELSDSVRANDTFVFFYAGHGSVAQIGPARSFFLAGAGVTDLNDGKNLWRQGVSAADLQTWLSRIGASSKLLVLDACNSGAMVNFFNGEGAIGKDVLGALRDQGKTAILAATDSSQVASESARLGHGVFTWALLKNERRSGERGEIRMIDDLISAARLALRTFKGLRQVAYMERAPSDFPLIVR